MEVARTAEHKTRRRQDMTILGRMCVRGGDVWLQGCVCLYVNVFLHECAW